MAAELDHLGIAVTSIEESLVLFRDLLGLPLAGEEIVAGEQVKVAMLPAGSSQSASRIELLESTEDSSPIARFLKTHGPGLHHVALRVDDLEETASRLASAGYQVLNEPKTGAGGHSYLFVHPRSTGGVLLELIGRINSEAHKPPGAAQNERGTSTDLAARARSPLGPVVRDLSKEGAV